ncbi:MAG: hypothetical protein QOJ38_1993 [Solirubrobacterales bacterium]|nr:hypothetical protein [Solirubrobacterales bacterium]
MLRRSRRYEPTTPKETPPIAPPPRDGARERTREILETAQDAFISIDDHGLITDWNPQAEVTFGWSRQEAIGRELAATIIPEAYREAHRKGLERFRDTGEGSVLDQRLELTAIHRGGREFPVEFTISALRSDEGYWCHAFLRDISERRLAESYMKTQHEATRVLAESASVAEAMPALLEAIGAGMGWSVGALWTPVDGDGAKGLRCSSFWHDPETPAVEFARASMEMTLMPGVGLPGRVWLRREPAWLPDVLVDPNFPRADAAAASGLHAAVCLPIRHGDEMLAAMEFFSEELRPPDRALVEMVDALIGQIGQFMQRKRAEDEADRLKAEFFALVSHELRTPLTSIIGYLDLLVETEEKVLTGRGRQYLDVLSRNTVRLDKLVADLLLLTQVEAGTFTVEPAEAELGSIARNSVESALPAAAERGIELRLLSVDTADCAGDATRLGQAVDNLISNALKFTDAGGQVDVRVRNLGDEGIIEVADTGAGIPAEERDQLFDRFSRGTRAKLQEAQGAGLGLAIAKAVIEAHGGTIEVTSEEGAGTSFRLRLPLRAMASPQPQPQPQRHDQPAPAGPQVV